MDRDEIEHPHLPTARRGYETAAVHEHLCRVADELDALRRGAAGRNAPATLAEDASSRVRSILEAAEASAQQLREEAGRDATAHIDRVERSAKEMLAKLDGMHAELDRLTAMARAFAGSLEQLGRDAGTTAGAGDTPASEAAAASNGAAPANAASSPPATRSDDEAGARLVALNMALEGAPRGEAARFLGERYELADVDALLDAVYTSAGK